MYEGGGSCVMVEVYEGGGSCVRVLRSCVRVLREVREGVEGGA